MRLFELDCGQQPGLELDPKIRSELSSRVAPETLPAIQVLAATEAHLVILLIRLLETSWTTIPLHIFIRFTNPSQELRTTHELGKADSSCVTYLFSKLK